MKAHDNSIAKGKGDRRSERHIRYQLRLARILTEHGYRPVEIEKPMPYYLPLDDGKRLRIRYRVDVWGYLRDGSVGVEIDGYMGHKSRRAYEMDGLRTRRIQEAYGPIDIYRFTFGQIASWTDEEIAQEMKLC